MPRSSLLRSGAFRFAILVAAIFAIGTSVLLVQVERSVNGYATEVANDSVAALGRRPPIAEAATRLSVADLEIDLLKRTVTRAGIRIDLQQQEYKLLEYLMHHAGEIVTRTMLLENVWSFHFDPGTNLIESHISRLRAKVDRGFDRELIHTVRNAGYRLDAAV